MSQFIESLTRLLQANQINENKLKELLKNNKITQQEYNHIISAKKVV